VKKAGLARAFADMIRRRHQGEKNMSIASRHARVWAGLALAACAPLVAAQTIEIYAGGNFYQDAPGTSVQVTPHALTVGPDGLVYITDYNGRLLRFDPAQGTVTALPGIPAHANFDLGTPYGIAFDPAGELFVATGSSLHRIDIAGGTTPYVGELGQGAMVYGADGTLYYASADDHRVRAACLPAKSLSSRARANPVSTATAVRRCSRT
jgi:DNA-binding beta-propeller fold protein YncE